MPSLEKDDRAGDAGPLVEVTPVRVAPRSRWADQLVEKTVGPKGPALARGGMDPARSRERTAAAAVVVVVVAAEDGVRRPSISGWKGLAVGVGRAERDSDGCGPAAGAAPLGDGALAETNREGRVPARTRRGIVTVVAEAGGSKTAGFKSGKPSVGDSGMFSRSGVEFPLVGGPQGCALIRSCA